MWECVCYPMQGRMWNKNVEVNNTCIKQLSVKITVHVVIDILVC